MLSYVLRDPRCPAIGLSWYILMISAIIALLSSRTNRRLYRSHLSDVSSYPSLVEPCMLTFEFSCDTRIFSLIVSPRTTAKRFTLAGPCPSLANMSKGTFATRFTLAGFKMFSGCASTATPSLLYTVGNASTASLFTVGSVVPIKPPRGSVGGGYTHCVAPSSPLPYSGVTSLRS